MRIYSLLDRKLKEFGPLVLANNDDAIKRAILDGIPGTGNMVEKHASDFDVYCLGDFDPESGELKPEAVPFLVECVESILRPVDKLS